jgi:predicted ATPase
MLQRLRIEGFKSLRKVEVSLPAFTVLFGPNSAGKSNFLDALQALSRVATLRTLGDALSGPIRGYPVEAFGFPPGGLATLLRAPSAAFTLEGDVEAPRAKSGGRRASLIRYRVKVAIAPESGALTVQDEYLSELKQDGKPLTPRIEVEDGHVLIRSAGKAGRPRKEPVGLNYTIVSDPRWAGDLYRPFERLRSELASWRVYYLDPRVSMRRPCPPSDVTDIGTLGENIAPFLHRLRAEKPKHFEAVVRTVCTLIPSIEDVRVDLDPGRGTLDIQVEQDGVQYSSRIISEGTLRVLALCAMAANPWPASLVAFEEPENGVHPRRLQLIADLLWSLSATPGRQVIVTTHSPFFCDAVLKSHERRNDLALVQVHRRGAATELRTHLPSGPLFAEHEFSEAMRQQGEDGVFEALIMRGLLDE